MALLGSYGSTDPITRPHEKCVCGAQELLTFRCSTALIHGGGGIPVRVLLCVNPAPAPGKYGAGAFLARRESDRQGMWRYSLLYPGRKRKRENQLGGWGVGVVLFPQMREMWTSARSVILVREMLTIGNRKRGFVPMRVAVLEKKISLDQTTAGRRSEGINHSAF